MSLGYISVHRQIRDNRFWLSEPFTKGQAWVDLILLANHKENTIFIRGNRIDVKRGQLAYSKERLAREWKWSEKKVNNFLKMMEKEGQIILIKTPSVVVVEIVNYTQFQEKEGQKKDRRRIENGQKKANNNVNNDNNEKIENQFEEFWTSYKSIHTSKGNKNKSKELLLKALKKESFENIMQGLQKYMDHCHKNNIYTKSVETWLRNEQWANEYENNSSKSNINKSLVKSLSILTKDTLIKNVSVSASNNAVLYFDKKSDYDKLISLDVEIRSKIKDQINKELGTNNFEFKY
jgi:hypothetical protein